MNSFYTFAMPVKIMFTNLYCSCRQLGSLGHLHLARLSCPHAAGGNVPVGMASPGVDSAAGSQASCFARVFALSHCRPPYTEFPAQQGAR